MGVNLIIAAALLFVSAFANAQTCIANKSIVWLDSDGNYQVRQAETRPFAVVSEEHETPYSLDFIEKSGATWGEVEVMTGTVMRAPEAPVFQVVAQILSSKKETITRLALVADKDSKFARAITTIDLPETDLDPSLTVDCKL